MGNQQSIGCGYRHSKSPLHFEERGYDLTFRLYHPNEHNGFTEYTEETFSFYFTEASLNIANFKFDDDEMQEGSVSTLSQLATSEPR